MSTFWAGEVLRIQIRLCAIHVVWCISGVAPTTLLQCPTAGGTTALRLQILLWNPKL